MNINEKFIIYISCHDPLKDKGVTNKIEGFCAVARKNGFKTKIISNTCNSLECRHKMLQEAIKSNAKYIFMRSFGAQNIQFQKSFLYAKQKGQILVLDQPTPMRNHAKEIWLSNISFLHKFYRILRLYINGPWGQWAFDRILQYAEESWYFKMGNRNKTIMIGNGIDIDRFDLRKKQKNNNEQELKIIGIAANISPWHGFDRIIRAMGIWKQGGGSPSIKFDIVGNNNSNYLTILAKEYGVENDVCFYGSRDASFIKELYTKEDLAVGSLGLYRNGLYTSSILKIREYCLVGIPFIAVGNDPDFPTDVPFRFVIPNDESVEPILDVFKNFFIKRKLFSDEQIREYAKEKLSFDVKFNIIMDGLCSKF